MSSSLRRQFSPLRSFSASLALLALAGCESDERSPRRGPPPSEAGAAAPAPAPEMSAHATFFAGQIETEVLLGRAGFGPRADGKDGPPGGGEGRGRSGFSGGFGGGGKRGGGGGPRGGDGPEGRSGPGRDAEARPRIVAENKPPVRLHLRLTNHSTEPAEIEVLDFNSDLGNFVVQPRKISVAPGASAEAEPMISRIGLSADAIPLTIRLRRSGQTEQQKLMLQVIAPPTPPPPPAP